MKSRKLSKKRGITIPKDIASQIGVYGGEAVDIDVGAGDTVTIKKHVPVCRFCHTANSVKKFGDIECCKNCAEELKKEVCNG